MSKTKIFKQVVDIIKDPEQIFSYGYDFISIYQWVKDNTLLTIILITLIISIILLVVFIISKILDKFNL